MSSLVSSAGVRLGAVEDAHETTDLLMNGTPVFLSVSLATEGVMTSQVGGRATATRCDLPVVGDSALSALYVSWLLAQLARQLHSFGRC